MKKNLMINLDKLKTCIENCKYAGDNSRNHNLFVSAAIMVIFSLDEKKNDQKLILIRRKKNLRKHAGQVAFPGGRFESDDKNLIKTALRETEEEINISENNLDVLGSLPVFYTGTGYAVTPFVAVIKNSFNYKKLMIADPNEVEKILIVNTSDLLMPSKQIRIKAPIGSKMKMTWKVAYKNENIWGLTARVLVTISAGLNLREYPPCDDI